MLSSRFLLDTHVWLWILFEDPRITKSQAWPIVERAEQHSFTYLSVVSLCEIGMLAAKKRIQIPTDCLKWVQEAIQQSNLQLTELTPEIAIGASYLPGDIHNDPADRLLISTARQLNATLVTYDTQILRYGEQGHVMTLSV